MARCWQPSNKQRNTIQISNSRAKRPRKEKCTPGWTFQDWGRSTGPQPCSPTISLYLIFSDFKYIRLMYNTQLLSWSRTQRWREKAQPQRTGHSTRAHILIWYIMVFPRLTWCASLNVSCWPDPKSRFWSCASYLFFWRVNRINRIATIFNDIRWPI